MDIVVLVKQVPDTESIVQIAENVSILLKQSDTTVLLKISDDGTGFDPSVSPHVKEAGTWGQLNMRERAEAMGGTLIVESAIGKGTRVIVEIPK